MNSAFECIPLIMPHSAKLCPYKKYGFTLVELLIVIAILGSTLTLVGPLAIDAVSKAQARTEVLSLQKWLTYQSQKAFVSGKNIHITFKGKRVLLLDVDNQLPISSREFQSLFFQSQEMSLSSHGISSINQLEAIMDGKNIVIPMPDWTDDNALK